MLDATHDTATPSPTPRMESGEGTRPALPRAPTSQPSQAAGGAARAYRERDHRDGGRRSGVRITQALLEASASRPGKPKGAIACSDQGAAP